MRSKMRGQELSAMAPGRLVAPPVWEVGVGSRLLETYAALAGRGEHLFAGLLGGRAPTQWAHYPDDDAIDGARRYQ